MPPFASWSSSSLKRSVPCNNPPKKIVTHFAHTHSQTHTQTHQNKASFHDRYPTYTADVHTFSLPHAHTRTCTHTHTHTQTHACMQSLSLSLSFPHTHTHTHTHKKQRMSLTLPDPPVLVSRSYVPLVWNETRTNEAPCNRGDHDHHHHHDADECEKKNRSPKGDFC
jgi:hypothetical protein